MRPYPTPTLIKQMREQIHLSMAEAGGLVYMTELQWKKCETGLKRMHPGLWELWKLKTTRS